MKKTIFFVLIIIFVQNLFANSTAAIDGKLNNSNPSSMYFSPDFTIDYSFFLEGLYSFGDDKKSSSGINLSIASRFFGLSLDMDSILFSKDFTSEYNNSFSINFFANYGFKDYSVAAKWSLRGNRVSDVGDKDVSFFNLLEYIFTKHNDNYISDNISSLSLFFGYFNKDWFSFSTFVEDAILLTGSNISLNRTSLLESAGVSFMLRSSEFNKNDIKNFVEVIFMSDVKNIFSRAITLNPFLKLKFNIARKTSISFGNLISFASIYDNEHFSKDSYHSLIVLFDVFEYRLFLKTTMPFLLYKSGEGGILFEIGFRVIKN